MKLIGLSGKKRSGKDTVACILQQCLPRTELFYHIHFAGALKQEVANATGHSLKYIEDHKENFRLILQGWGTDYRRKLYGKDYWVKRLSEKIRYLENSGATFIVVSDVRFQNEADLIKKLGGQVWRIERELASSDAHPSETDLDDYKFDVEILNIGTISDLVDYINQLIPKI
jgi:hypothetical protein